MLLIRTNNHTIIEFYIVNLDVVGWADPRNGCSSPIRSKYLGPLHKIPHRRPTIRSGNTFRERYPFAEFWVGPHCRTGVGLNQFVKRNVLRRQVDRTPCFTVSQHILAKNSRIIPRENDHGPLPVTLDFARVVWVFFCDELDELRIQTCRHWTSPVRSPPQQNRTPSSWHSLRCATLISGCSR